MRSDRSCGSSGRVNRPHVTSMGEQQGTIMKLSGVEHFDAIVIVRSR
jgi:hypothetical protein